MRSAPMRKRSSEGIEWLREDYGRASRFLQTVVFLAYLSNEADGERMEVYLRRLMRASPDVGWSGCASVQERRPRHDLLAAGRKECIS